MSNILLIEDDIAFSQMLTSFLRKKGYIVFSNSTAKNITKLIKENSFDLVLTDMRLPEKDGISVLEEIKSLNSQLPVVLMTGYADVSTAVRAMKKGAFDYISKPFCQDEVLHIISKALNRKSKKINIDNDHIPVSEEFIIGTSEVSVKLQKHIELVAPTNMSVLIIGESGTGKEVVAKTIHKLSNRHNENFIAVDCGAIPKEIAASEFFGHLKGSFTGAVTNQTGSFEAANNGTLFLDEIGNLSYGIQVQLLRVLQERKIKPIGSALEMPIDIRVIAATNENLERAVKKGNFREDLYHRLNEFSIKLPSLNERGVDIMMYAYHFLKQANKVLDRKIIGFSIDVETLFLKYRWPGNLRELQNIVKRATLLSNENIITKEVLPESFWKNKEQLSVMFNKKGERVLIMDALKKTNNNKSKAALLLNIDRKTLYNKLKKYNI